MIVLKHVEHKIQDPKELEELLNHLRETTSKISGVELKDIWFPLNKDEFILVLECSNEGKYLEWREMCPPPPGAEDWYEVLLLRDEVFQN